MRRVWLGIGALNGLLAVVAGAFGAHALKGRLSAEHLAIFETAARYQMYHGIALIGIAAHSEIRRRLLDLAGWCMVAGVILFSGSLYGLGLTDGTWRWLGPVTPIGGSLFLVGWLLIVIHAWRKRTHVSDKGIQ